MRFLYGGLLVQEQKGDGPWGATGNAGTVLPPLAVKERDLVTRSQPQDRPHMSDVCPFKDQSVFPDLRSVNEKASHGVALFVVPWAKPFILWIMLYFKEMWMGGLL